jgi:lysozyme family protein
MSEANFPACLAIVLQSEGGFTESLNDGSIATNLGVTLHTWSGYIGHTASIAEMEALTPAEVSPLYHSEFWNACDCQLWPAGVDLMVFDDAVNTGPGSARRRLQSAAGAIPDGSIGPATEAAVAALTASALIDRIALAREAFYRSLPTFPRFGNGWFARVNRTAALAHQMVKP